MRTIFSVSIVMVMVMASLTSAGAQAPANTAATPPQITFTKDVAPIPPRARAADQSIVYRGPGKVRFQTH